MKSWKHINRLYYTDDYVNRGVKALLDHNVVCELIEDYVRDVWKMDAEETDSGTRIKISW